MTAMLAIDPETHDLATGEDGGLYDVTNYDALVQDLRMLCDTIAGELDWAVDIGIPMEAEVTEVGTTPERIGAIYRERIMKRPGVVRFIEYPKVVRLDATSTATLTFRVETLLGEVSFSAPVQGV